MTTYVEGTNPTRIHATVTYTDSAGATQAKNISAAITMDIAVRDPNGVVAIETAAFDSEEGVGDGTDGKIFADYSPALFKGRYNWDCRVVIGSNEVFTTSGYFDVIENIR